MTEADARELVRRLEPIAAAAPGRYRVMVAALGVLGYGYILLMLALVIAVGAGIIAILLATKTGGLAFKVVIPVAALAIAIARAFWVRLEPPSGVPISRRDGKALWDAVDQLRKPLAAPRVHQILITDSLNAAIVQIPRLGIFGWQKNYLLLGLPLLQGLRVDQVLAVVGHELGHLSGNHSRFAGFVYRLRQTWFRLLVSLEEQGSALGQALFTRFFRWYVPYFNAYSFVLARADEYEADRCAVQVTSPEAARSALTRIAATAGYLDAEYWPAVAKRIGALPAPPPEAMSHLGRTLQTSATPDALGRFVELAMTRPTDYADTHPSLPDRLRGLGWSAPPPATWSAPPRDREDAATAFLGERTPALAERFGEEWREKNQAPWGDRHHELRRISAGIAELEAAARAGPLSAEDGWQLVTLVDQVDPDRAAPMVQQFAAAHPGHAEGRFCAGRDRLALGDPAGLDDLAEAARLDVDFLIPAHRLMAVWHREHGDAARAAELDRVADARARLIDDAIAERKTISREMVLEAAGIPEDQLSDIRSALARHRDALEVYVVRRVVTIMPEYPCYLVGIRPRRRFGSPVIDEPALIQAVLNTVPWPQRAYAVAVVGKNGWLRKRLRAMDALLIEQ